MRTIIGNPSVFAVEYELDLEDLAKHKNSSRRLGGLRLWLHDKYLGKIEDVSFWGSAIYVLVFLRDRPRGASTLFADESRVPEFWELVDIDDWSLNESFDDFLCVYYCTENTSEVHFKWTLSQNPHFSYDNYPEGIHHARVPYQTYDDVINELLEAVYPDGYEKQNYDDLPPGLTPLI
ncbi:hypothetical protein [Gimesia fumaroli]|uniref:Uncharacterized protein n=1 Tax=Gimesia fumaroli TaxID=2527976 RepID=A0A518I9K2_9PLAN|nr:hypothetical protein [Gimesia fumaroli]QDV49739.1 hypothetical protein Enr17x_17600 [Gimesia fumaroli]